MYGCVYICVDTELLTTFILKAGVGVLRWLFKFLFHIFLYHLSFYRENYYIYDLKGENL